MEIERYTRISIPGWFFLLLLFLSLSLSSYESEPVNQSKNILTNVITWLAGAPIIGYLLGEISMFFWNKHWNKKGKRGYSQFSEIQDFKKIICKKIPELKVNLRLAESVDSFFVYTNFSSGLLEYGRRRWTIYFTSLHCLCAFIAAFLIYLFCLIFWHFSPWGILVYVFGLLIVYLSLRNGRLAREEIRDVHRLWNQLIENEKEVKDKSEILLKFFKD